MAKVNTTNRFLSVVSFYEKVNHILTLLLHPNTVEDILSLNTNIKIKKKKAYSSLRRDWNSSESLRLYLLILRKCSSQSREEITNSGMWVVLVCGLSGEGAGPGLRWFFLSLSLTSVASPCRVLVHFRQAVRSGCHTYQPVSHIIKSTCNFRLKLTLA